MWKTTCVTSLLGWLGGAEIQEFMVDTNFRTVQKNHEFSIINFYDSSEDAQGTKKAYELAHEKFKQVKGSYGRDVGWYSVDIEMHPHLKPKDIDGPNQIMTYKSYMIKQRKLDHTYAKGEPYTQKEIEDMAEAFVHDVMGLSGDFVNGVDCKDIMSPDTMEDEWELVYFGSEDALATEITTHEGKKYTQYQELMLAAMVERYEFIDEFPTVLFQVNTDPKCAKEFDLDPKQHHVVLFVKDTLTETSMFKMTEDSDHILDMDMIHEFVGISIVRAMPQWSHRTASTLYHFHANAIIYMVPFIPDNDPETLHDDWRYRDFIAIADYTHEYVSGHIIPIIASADDKSHPEYGLPDLHDFLEVDVNDLP